MTTQDLKAELAAANTRADFFHTGLVIVATEKPVRSIRFTPADDNTWSVAAKLYRPGCSVLGYALITCKPKDRKTRGGFTEWVSIDEMIQTIRGTERSRTMVSVPHRWRYTLECFESICLNAPVWRKQP